MRAKRNLDNGTFKAVKDGIEYLIRVIGMRPFLTVTNCVNLNLFKEKGIFRNDTATKKLIQETPELFEYYDLIFEDDIPNRIFSNSKLINATPLPNKKYWDECAERLDSVALQIKMSQQLKISLSEARELMHQNGYK